MKSKADNNNFYRDVTFSIIDFETTGLSPLRDRAIEVGIVKIKNGKILDRFSSFINPGILLPEFITNLTGITNDDLSDAPAFEYIASKIKSFIMDSVLVAHNLQFDYSFLRSEFERADIEIPQLKTLCTVKLSKFSFPDLKSKSLKNLVKHLHIRHVNVHRALGDAEATAKVLIKILVLLSNNPEITSIDKLISLTQYSPSKIQNVSININQNAIPKNPGVYFFKNKFDKIIYIGKSKSLKDRIKNHFQESASTNSHKIAKRASSVEIKETNSELTALIAEAEYIKEFNPDYNSLLKRYPKSYFLKFRLHNKFPVPEEVASFSFDGDDYFGPFVRRKDVNTLIETINNSFELRECSDKILSKSISCYLQDIQRCIAPCENNNGDKYSKELEKVYDFLAGNNTFVTDRLLRKMKIFSDSKKYEQAADIRDSLNNIFKNINKLSVFSEPINKTNAVIKVSCANKSDLILIKWGKVYIQNFDNCKKEYFNTLIDDYYKGTIFIDNDLDEKNLERMRIILSWIIKNKSQIKIFYLKNYPDKNTLLSSVLT